MFRAILILALTLFSTPLRAEEPVDLELLLAVDASGSVDSEEFAFQLNGIAAAFQDADVQAAIAAGELGRIAVALMIWSDATAKRAISEWRIVEDRASAESFAMLAQAQFDRRRALLGKSGTGIGAAVGAGVRLIRRNGIDGSRKVIDVSGDGHETPLRFGEGMALPEARRRANRRDIVVNGLAIESDFADLTTYYERAVITGPGSFVITAEGYADFARAMKQKLLREIMVLTDAPRPPVRWAGSSSLRG